ncbi:hypothetical protein [Brachybacterium nesterenkovii]|uniref:hypothetical protein n=1 Tax=Brachybacterium nesterenkovii TaxID=47847 RepID=UPI001F304E56|nr:hypothetical protein [Brachybacterium nesterenkovii]
MGARWALREPGRGGVLAPGGEEHLFAGRALPEHLAPYAPGPHTLGQFLENQLNPDDPAPIPAPAENLEPRLNQYEAADAIAADAAAGGRQFLLADEPGVGKTISAVLGASAVGDLRGAQRVLVVADRPAAITIGHWCRTITALGDSGLEWVVITWEPPRKGHGARLGRDHRGRGPCAAAHHHEAVEAVGEDLGAQHTA